MCDTPAGVPDHRGKLVKSPYLAAEKQREPLSEPDSGTGNAVCDDMLSKPEFDPIVLVSIFAITATATRLTVAILVWYLEEGLIPIHSAQPRAI